MPYAVIPLRGGAPYAHARVDLADYDDLAAHSWYVSDGYAVRSSPRAGGHKLIRMHRVLLGLGHRDPLEGDHINGNRLDNRRRNLRAVTKAQNAQNRGVQHISTSGIRCVTRHKLRWRAYGTLNGKNRHIGLFLTREEADVAARAWRAEHMPFSVD